MIVDPYGVVWKGHEAIAGSARMLAEVQRRGMPIAFLTNDPSSSRLEYAARLAGLAAKTTATEVVTAGRAILAMAPR
jgi:ribonucleotide monophosphatase NagD (HAD superfamily)